MGFRRVWNIDAQFADAQHRTKNRYIHEPPCEALRISDLRTDTSTNHLAELFGFRI
jgi:hypothetical protein